MPAPIWYSHRLVQRQSELRKDGRLPWLRPDAKSQVTFRYVNGRPVEVDTVVLSTQHAPEISQAAIREAVIEDYQAQLPRRPDHAPDQVPGQPDRPLRHRRPQAIA